ncbi:MAG TPA: nitronate monooxygenase family protein [Acidimicrobiales bacterium]|jgi:NAD(P)H-dependent flavin oxidoreductase YrpB (nitropropane dioxygenase family)|nr:nitronate monooxygenase family protein [Acidimicrobiales bacterium]
MKTDLCEMFGIEFPIFAFTHCRDVAAAVSKAGGMGVLGALAFTPEQLEIELTWIDEHCGGKPYGVDVVMPVKTADRDAGLHDTKELAGQLYGMIDQKHWDYADKILADHGVPPLPEDDGDASGEMREGLVGEGVLGWTEASGTPLIDVALGHDISLLASALGPPPKDAIDRAHAQGVKVAALIGRVEQAIRDVQQGVDIVIAQGYEAGGHTGEVATMVLVPDVVDAISPVPVLAAGGIGSGRQMAAAMALGAQGVWTGSIWLTTTESNTGEIAMEKLLRARSSDTVRSRALTGKPARQLRTAWTEAWEAPESPGTLPMPLQFILNSKAMRRITRSGNKDLTGMPVGQIVSRMNEVKPCKDVIFEMVEEYVAVMDRLGGQLTS